MDASKTRRYVREQALAWGVRISESAVTPTERADCNAIPDFGTVQIVHPFSSVLPALPDSEIGVEACFPHSQSG
jgi:hypothetical protein